MRIPIRQLVAFAVALGLTVLLAVYLSKTFMGRAIRAVAQDEEALRLMGANPVRIKQFAFGIATAVLGMAGALLIIVAPVEPTLDRAYIGRTFCVVVMAGLGSITGTLIAAIILGVAETIVLTLVRRLLGAGDLVRNAARRACRAAARSARPMTMRRNNIAFWAGVIVFLVAVMAMTQFVRNEYPFFAGYVILQFIALAVAWTILGGYAGYVNFGTNAFFGVGVYTAVALFKATGAPLAVQIAAAAFVGMLLGLGDRSPDPADARHLLLDRDDCARDHHRDVV